MNKSEISGVMKAVADVVREYVASAYKVLADRIDQLEAAIKQLPVQKDGRDASQEQIDAAVRAVVDALPKPKDGVDGKNGESVHPDTIFRMVTEKVADLGANIKHGTDGAAGRDALDIDILPSIDSAKSYPRGTYAQYRGGVIRAHRNTDPIVDGLDKAGWSVVMNGIADETEESADEGRTIKRVTTYTNGFQLVRAIKTSVAIYRGIFKAGEQYSLGDFVTSGGSVWHCESREPTTDEPGTGTKAWRLAVKRGRDGKDATKDVQIKHEPVRLK